MRIAVFGANGGIGQQFIRLALNSGHELHLYSRKSIDISDQSSVKLFNGELSDIDSIKRTIKGCDAVVSLLGPKLKFTYPGTPIINGHINIIQAMNDCGVSRFITIATPAIRFEHDKTSFVTVVPKLLARLFMPKPYKEIIGLGEVTRTSGLDWTIVRFLAPVDGDLKGNVRVTMGDKKIKFKISRADIASFILDEISERKHVQSMPIIGG